MSVDTAPIRVDEATAECDRPLRRRPAPCRCGRTPPTPSSGRGWRRPPATLQPALRRRSSWSDVVSGVLIVVLSGLACSPRFRWAPWAVAGVGLWLMAAPLVFWAPTAAAYATDTLVGTLVFAFAVLVPGTPGTRDLPGPDVPPGWSYNPSAWPQRAGIIALAFVQFFAARYMAAHQLGHVPHAWDPFFGDGTYRVLNSDVSKAFPVSDAGLGAFTYLVEALTGLPRRHPAVADDAVGGAAVRRPGRAGRRGEHRAGRPPAAGRRGVVRAVPVHRGPRPCS